MKTDLYTTLDELLPMYLAQVGWSERQLAKRANIPRGTIRNWCKGLVNRPRNWRRLIQAASAMRLDETQTNELLRVAGHATLARLNAQAQLESDKTLLAFWFAQKQTVASFQAIPDIPYFVGREEELAALKTLLLQDDHRSIYVLSGMAGVGKTSLAAHLAYEVRAHFVDGILWARVDTGDTMSILKMLAETFGQDVNQYSDMHSRSQAVRTILAHKQALLILDNIESSQQIQPLLPPNGPCAVLLTTRHTNLQIARGCPHIHLQSFRNSTQFSNALFAKIMGDVAAASEQKTLTEIADLLGHLPLALAIVAGRIAYEPHGSAADLLIQLQAEKGRLTALAFEDQNVQASLNASYETLSPSEQTFFAATGVFGGEDFSLEAVTAVTNTPLAAGRSHLNRLYGFSLVQTSKNKRYRLHPLLQEYAKGKISDTVVYQRMVTYFAAYVQENQTNYRALELEKDNIITAVTAAFTYHMTAEAIAIIIDFSHFLTVTGSREMAAEQLQKAEKAANRHDDLAQFALIKCAQGNLEKDKTAALARNYFAEGLELAHASQDKAIIAGALKDAGIFYYEQSEYEAAETCCQQSLILARQTNQYKLLGFLINFLASLAINHHGDYRRAEGLHLEGLALQREHNNQSALCMQLMNLSMIAFSLGDYAQSSLYLQESTIIAEQIGHRLISIILTRRRAALLVAQQGDYKAAQVYLQTGVQLARALQHDAVLGFVLAELGIVTGRLGEWETAVSYLNEARHFARQTKRQDIEIEALTGLGYIAAQQNRNKTAETYYQNALSSAHELNDVWFLGRGLEGYGDFLLAIGQFEQAKNTFAELLRISRQSELLEMVGTALFGLARAAQAQLKVDEARQLGMESLITLEAIKHFQAERVKDWLDA